MGLALLPLMAVDLAAHPGLVCSVLLVHAVAAATQDAAIDTLAVRTVAPDERGIVNGWMQLGMLLARALFGGGALLLATRVGDPAVIALLVAAVWGTSLVLVLGVPADGDVAPADEGDAAGGVARAQIVAMLRDPVTYRGVAFAALVGAGFEAATGLAGPLLLSRGVHVDAIGAFFFVPVVVLMATGALIGGRCADRWGRRRATAGFEAAAATVVLALGSAALWLPAHGWGTTFVVLFGVLYLTIGLATAALYGLFMDLTDPRIAATQFCAYMAGINLCYVWSTPVLGVVAARAGYGPGLCALALVSFAALGLLQGLPGDGSRRE
jgi:PAT family beta-lactamase induction signal transducer AmpG